MSRAITAHADLIRGIKDREVQAHVPDGRITMFVPDGGGVAIRLERMPQMPEPDLMGEQATDVSPEPVNTRDPVEVTFEVLESPSSCERRTECGEPDAGVLDEGGPYRPS